MFKKSFSIPNTSTNGKAGKRQIRSSRRQSIFPKISGAFLLELSSYENVRRTIQRTVTRTVLPFVLGKSFKNMPDKAFCSCDALIAVSVILEILLEVFLPIIIYADFLCVHRTVHVTIHVTVRRKVLDHTVTVTVTVTIYKSIYVCLWIRWISLWRKLEISKNIFRKTIDTPGGSVTMRSR